MIHALFVSPSGPYANASFDWWDELRDARKFKGPGPVIAHPPCQLWGKFAKINYARWGGAHNRPGNDKGCFESALKSVRTYGGVLEHPGSTYAWEKYKLLKPTEKGWNRMNINEWTCEVWQSSYGHKANKRTWLFYKGDKHPIQLRWERKIGSHQIGFYDQRGKLKNKPTVSRKEAIHTPILFLKDLVRLVS